VPVDREAVAAWLAAYVDAWRSYDAAAIGELFSRDATYRYHPWDEPVRGRAAIVADWLTDQDPPGSWEAEYEPLVVDGDVAVVTGRSSYVASGDAPARQYWNCWVLRFDGDGRCADFTEWFMVPPGEGSPSAG
jgi:ketosteroid isomerase-like protein